MGPTQRGGGHPSTGLGAGRAHQEGPKGRPPKRDRWAERWPVWSKNRSHLGLSLRGAKQHPSWRAGGRSAAQRVAQLLSVLRSSTSEAGFGPPGCLLDRFLLDPSDLVQVRVCSGFPLWNSIILLNPGPVPSQWQCLPRGTAFPRNQDNSDPFASPLRTCPLPQVFGPGG